MTEEQRAKFDALVEESKCGERMKERKKNRDLHRRLSWIAIEILVAMEEKKITPEMLAESLEIPLEDVALLKKGRLDFSVSLALKLEKLLGIWILNPTITED